MDFRADEIEIVEHLRGLGKPGGAIRRRWRTHVRAWSRLRCDADASERAGEIESRRRLGGRQVGFDRVRPLLRNRCPDAKPCHDRKCRGAYSRGNRDSIDHSCPPVMRVQHTGSEGWTLEAGAAAVLEALTTDGRPLMTECLTLPFPNC